MRNSPSVQSGIGSVQDSQTKGETKKLEVTAKLKNNLIINWDYNMHIKSTWNILCFIK